MFLPELLLELIELNLIVVLIVSKFSGSVGLHMAYLSHIVISECIKRNKKPSQKYQ